MNIFKLGGRGKELSSELVLFLGGWGKGLLVMPATQSLPRPAWFVSLTDQSP